MFGITAFAESPFSSLGGDLASVNVSLSSLAITSSVGSISLVGDAKINGIITSDLEEFDTFNLDLDFFSTISENIPWYVAIIGGIPAAAGAVVVTDILEEDLIQISKSSYKINGNIDNLAITPKEQ